jgi:hypothetical protein
MSNLYVDGGSIATPSSVCVSTTEASARTHSITNRSIVLGSSLRTTNTKSNGPKQYAASTSVMSAQAGLDVLGGRCFEDIFAGRPFEIEWCAKQGHLLVLRDFRTRSRNESSVRC